MIQSVADWLNLATIVAGFSAAILLYLGSIGVPKEMQSWKGETEPEVQLRRKRRLQVVGGVACAIVTAICQAVVILAPRLSN